jgi:DNA primase
MNLDPSTTKYLIKAKITADGVVEKPDVVGAIFGQTEGLLGDELDLRDLQKSGRMGRIEVQISSDRGKSAGEIRMPSSLDQVETCILASALETIDRVGPCKAKIRVEAIEDVRQVKKKQIVDRAKELLTQMMEENKTATLDLTSAVRDSVQVDEIVSYGKDKCPAGPNVSTSDAVIVVEGRSDVLNLLKHGIKNAIAVEGTNIPRTIQELAAERVVTAFVDGDRGGELILRELLQTIELDFVTRAPRNREVEELTQKQIIKALRNKIPVDQYIEMYNLSGLVGNRQEGDRGGRGGGQEGEHRRNGGRRDDRRERGPREAPPDVPEAPPTDLPEPPFWAEEEVEGAEEGAMADVADMAEAADPGSEQGKPSVRLTEDQLKYIDILERLSGRLKANIIDADGQVIQELDVKDLTGTLKNVKKKVKAIVFDGVITQRLLDIAAEKSVQDVVGKKIGNVTATPQGLNVWTLDDLAQ